MNAAVRTGLLVSFAALITEPASAADPVRVKEVPDLPGVFRVDAAGFAEVSTAASERGANIAGRPVPVVGHREDDERHAGRSIPFVIDLVVILAARRSDCALNSAVDVFLWHVLGASLLDREPEAHVGVWVRESTPGRNGDFASELGEKLTALGVIGALGAFDRCPF